MKLTNKTEVLRMMQESLIEGFAPSREVIRTGGFISLFSESSALPWVNQTLPDGFCSLEDVRAIFDTHVRHGREPFFEFCEDLWPDIPALLEQSGLIRKQTMPLMVLLRSDARSHNPKHPVRFATAMDAESIATIGHAAFGEAPPDAEAIASTAGRLGTGQFVASVVSIDRVPAGCAQIVGTRAIKEVAGVATASEFRRRGVATTAIGFLLNHFFSDGGEIAWLTPGDDSAEKVYTGLGFQTIAHQVCYAAC